MGLTSMRVDPGTLKFTILAIGNARISLARASQAAVHAAGDVYKRAVKESISLTDHSLADLAALDHPYARRHRVIQTHRLGHSTLGGRIASAASLVHRQSGKMRRALRGRMVRYGKRAAYEVDFDSAIAPHAESVLLGTPRMLPRYPLWDTAIAPLTLREMRMAVVRELGAKLRSQAIVRFVP